MEMSRVCANACAFESNCRCNFKVTTSSVKINDLENRILFEWKVLLLGWRRVKYQIEGPMWMPRHAAFKAFDK